MNARLTGRRLLLTRSAEDCAGWAEALTAEGALPIVFPCIATELCEEPGLTERITAAAAEADWIVFTSRRGVDAFAELIAAGTPMSAKLAAVGETTARHLGETMGEVDLVGGGTAARLAGELAHVVRENDSILLALAANAGDVLERVLTGAGAAVTRCNVYRTVAAPRAESRRALSTLGSDTVIFASPSAVTGFENQISVDIAQQIVTIGPSTSAAVRKHNWEVAAEAKEPNLNGIIESILETDHV
ncbi:MAG TPA: uroporphyrinogen-III synthase [Gammaproteobacteria bacterium]|jgi:uroporphyrinogen-III synthase